MQHDDGYKPRHHHLERRAGSSTGGVSQIFFGEETANLPLRPPTAKQPRAEGAAASFAERNASSAIFDFAHESTPAPPPSTGRARAAGSSRAQISQLSFSFDQPAVLSRDEPARAERPSTARTNPIFGGAFDGLSERAPAEQDARLAVAVTRARSDPNRPSQAGGIFGFEAVARPVQPRRHVAIEEAPVARYGTKRMVEGRMEYCA
ncbi:hypothetical protein KFE25_007898 [Diacronema lutheri]|uniref:Uncharacterized protein n=1 Tax=Diacronema lutheri TaxID=2081491 RepID=A0A8J5XU00_DIALT|nr:hypothetical protein KFE25_007898 [Diacronema lutheri]